jgi:peptidoglycan/LPS O-acetylase OafA/YrhL
MVWRSVPVETLARTWRALAPGVLTAPSGMSELPRGHIPALDAIRGLAIVLVTIYRFGGGSDGPARAIADVGLIGLGEKGVDLFFVLSGFLITGILFDAKGKDHYFRNFYMRRTLRIFPLYYAALVLSLLVLPRFVAGFGSAVDGQAWLWLYGTNVWQAFRGEWCLGPLNHFWSLAIEEHFYLVWPLAIYLTSRRGATWLAGGLGAASILARALWLQCGGNDVAAEVFTPLRMDGLLLGGWIALAARGPQGLTWLTRLAWPVLLFAGLAALGTELLNLRLLGLPNVAWAAACGSLLVLVVAASQQSWLARCGQSRWLQFFGKYSYGMYVFQLPLIFLLAPLVTATGLASLLGSAWLGQLTYCGLMFAATTLAALVSWHFFEKHWLGLKHRFGG